MHVHEPGPSCPVHSTLDGWRLQKRGLVGQAPARDFADGMDCYHARRGIVCPSANSPIRSCPNRFAILGRGLHRMVTMLHKLQGQIQHLYLSGRVQHPELKVDISQPFFQIQIQIITEIHVLLETNADLPFSVVKLLHCSPFFILLGDDPAGKECPANPEEGSGDTTDYFDVLDLGNLRRQLQVSLEDFRRERSLYIDIVRSHLEVTPLPTDTYHTPCQCYQYNGQVSQAGLGA